MGMSVVNADNPYQEIVAKNAFKLKELVVETKVELPLAPVERSSIVLSGMVKVEGRKQVFLSVTKQGEKEAKYLQLGEQERTNGIEVQEIDLKQERVRITHNGQPMVLTFATHGLKSEGQSMPVTATSNLQLQKPLISKPIPQTGELAIEDAEVAGFSKGRLPFCKAEVYI